MFKRFYTTAMYTQRKTLETRLEGPERIRNTYRLLA